MEGRIHSVESFGTVDGPGIRFVVFLQGCPMRCQYCHNPDTWDPHGGQTVTVAGLLERYRKNKVFYQKGGITATGGEPLLQLDFVTELFETAKQEGIHTCLDTSGCTFQPDNPDYLQKLDRLLAATDLVMLDLKEMDQQKHKELTGVPNQRVLDFARHVSSRQVPLWIRHVVIPGITDRESNLQAMGAFMAQLSTVKALDVLPYHTLGIAKYRELGISYALEGIEPATPQQADAAKQQILQAYQQARKK